VCVLVLLVLMWFSVGFLERKVYEVADETAFLIVAMCADGDTIKLVNDVQVNNRTIIVENAGITIDLNGHTLNLVNSEETALLVNNGSVKLTGDGELNVSGVGPAVIVKGKSSVEVTTVTATVEDSFGVAVFGVGSSLEINGSVQVDVTGECGYGVGTDFGGNALVEGDLIVTGKACAAYASGSASSVEVLGDIEVNGDDGMGALAYSGARCVVRGEARINGGYGTAVFADGEGSTVEVWRDVIVSEGGVGARALNGGEVFVHGNALAFGDFSASVYIEAKEDAQNPGSVIIGGNAQSSGRKCKSVSVENCGKVIIKGDVLAEGSYVEPWKTAEGLTIGGKYHGNGTCLSTDRSEGRNEECSITVLGNVVGKESSGARADGGNITVYGDVTTSEGYTAGSASFGGTLEIYGNVTTTGDDAEAVSVGLDGTVKVTGEVKVVGSNSSAVHCSQGTATILGAVTAIGENSIGAYADMGGTLTIDGSITAPNNIQLSQSIMRDEDGTTGEGAYRDYIMYIRFDTIVNKDTIIRVRNR
jgi:hypothetical protein